MTDSSSCTTSGPSRRTVVSAAAWGAPAIVAATAAPALAATNDAWTIASTSWEGSNLGTRNNNGNYRLRFTITVAANATVVAPQMVLTLRPAGTGGNINGVTAASPTAVVDGWTVTASNNVAGTDDFRTFTFTRSDIVGGTTGSSDTLNFSLLDVVDTDVNANSAAVFSSGNPAIHPVTSFTLLATNAGAAPGYITSPPA